MRSEGPPPCPHRRVRETGRPIVTPADVGRKIVLPGRCLDCGRKVRRKTPPVAFGPWEADEGDPVHRDSAA